MSTNDHDKQSVQELRTEAHRFFAELKHELHELEGDLSALDRELAVLDGMQEKLERDIDAIEGEAMEYMDKRLIELLNEADKGASAA